MNSLTPGEQKSQIHLIVQSLWEKRLFGVKPYDHVTGDEIAASESNNDKVEVKPITPIVSKPHSPRTVSPIPSFSHSPSAAGNAGGGVPMKSSPSIIPPSSLRHQQHTGGINTAPLLPTLLQSVTQAKVREQQHSDAPNSPSSSMPSISVIQQTGQPIIVPQQASSATQQQSPSYSLPPHQRLAPSASLHSRYSSTVPQFSNGVSSTKPPPIAPVAPMVTDRELQIQEERVRLLRQQLLAAANQRPS